MIDFQPSMARETHDGNGPDPIQGEKHEHEFNDIGKLQDKEVTVFHTLLQKSKGQAGRDLLKLFPGDFFVSVRDGQFLRHALRIPVKAVTHGQVVEETLF
jgi:hypothetical protein